MNSIVKRSLYLATRLAQVRLGRNDQSRQKASRIVFYPAFQNQEELADQLSRIKWYVPDVADISVKIALAPSLASLPLEGVPAPEYHRKEIEGTIQIQVIPQDELDKELRKADLVCLWNMGISLAPVLRAVNWLKIRIVDPRFFLFAETHTYPAIYYYDLLTGHEREQMARQSAERFSRLFLELGGAKRAYVFGTGPSLSNALQFKYDDGVRIVCNSIVKNDELLRHIQPQVVVFIDSVFHFGVSQYAGEFARDLLKVVREYNPYLITNQVGKALLEKQLPEIASKIIAIPAKRWGKAVILRPGSFRTRDYKNVLTRSMLPLAAGLSKEVVLLGYDGRKPSENRYFWQHNSAAQYTSAMDSTKLSHPAFFTDISYDRYYDGHCANLEKMIGEFEREDIRAYSWTKSYIPALSRRYSEQ